MSFLAGTLSGAVVAGSIYYAFSYSIQSSSTSHRTNLHALSKDLLAPSPSVAGPIPAAQRIEPSSFTTTVKGQWNQELGNLYNGVWSWRDKVKEATGSR